MSLKAFDYIPGVPAAGHLTRGGYWHPGPASSCHRCEPPEYPSITCPKCKRTSYNRNDIREGYCGWCHDWTSPPATEQRRT